jgi:hypothetical protein
MDIDVAADMASEVDYYADVAADVAGDMAADMAADVADGMAVHMAVTDDVAAEVVGDMDVVSFVFPALFRLVLMRASHMFFSICMTSRLCLSFKFFQYGNFHKLTIRFQIRTRPPSI